MINDTAYEDVGDLLAHKDVGDLLVYKGVGDLLVYKDVGDLLVYKDVGDLLVYKDVDDLLVYKDVGDRCATDWTVATEGIADVGADVLGVAGVRSIVGFVHRDVDPGPFLMLLRIKKQSPVE